MKELLDFKRQEWMELTWGKTFPGWGIAELDRKIDEYKENKRQIEERETLEQAMPSVIVKKVSFKKKILKK
jgi:hypothetical protein